MTKAPKLPLTSDSTTAPPVGNECSAAQIIETNPTTTPLTIPKKQKLPNQAHGSLKPTPS